MTEFRFFLAMLKVMWKVFYNSFVANLFALFFIFFLTRLMAIQGEGAMTALTYIARIEQLILILFGALIAVILPDTAKLIRQKEFLYARENINRGARYLGLIGVVMIASTYLAIFTFGQSLLGSVKTYDRVLVVAGFWFIGYLLQGVGLLYLQVTNIFLEPKLAPKINFIRFAVLGIPLLYGANHFWQFKGLMYALPTLHGMSLVLVYRLFQKSWSKFEPIRTPFAKEKKELELDKTYESRS